MKPGKIVVIGNREDVLPFKALGVETVVIEDPHSTIMVLRNIIEKDKDVSLILVSQDIIGSMRDEIENIINKTPTPVISIIPGRTSKAEPADMRKLLMKALGFG